MIKANMFDPRKLEKSMEHSIGSRETQIIVEKQLQKMDQDAEKSKKDKLKNLDQYASGKINRTDYAEKSRQYDNEIEKIQTERKNLMKEISTLHKQDAVDISIRRFCEAARTQFERALDPELKRQFLLDYIEKITYVRNKVTIRGSVPISAKATEDTDQSSKIDFCINGEITKQWRMKNLMELKIVQPQE